MENLTLTTPVTIRRRETIVYVRETTVEELAERLGVEPQEVIDALAKGNLTTELLYPCDDIDPWIERHGEVIDSETAVYSKAL